jgi:hypothetical protein
LIACGGARALAACNLANGHDSCASDKYCDAEGVCYACAFCEQALDPYNGICPSKCTGGSDTYTVGDTTPGVTEDAAAGAIRDAIGPECPGYDKLVTTSVPDIVFADDQPMGESNRSAPRLALKLQLLATNLRTVMTAMGHPTNLPVLKVLVAYRCVNHPRPLLFH